MSRSWDVFCKVVDNFGDAAVCWRLAQQLAAEHGGRVRLWIDDPAPLAALCPDIVAGRETQSVFGVEVRHWRPDAPSGNPADVVIDAFGCGLPDAYAEAMAVREPRSLWIILEYLSAEPWVAGHHGLPSPHPRLRLERYFFFPGVVPGTGGVLREAGLESRRAAFAASAGAKSAFWQALGFTAPDPGATVVSLFGYESRSAETLLRAWSAGPDPVIAAVTDCRIRADVEAFFGGAAARPGTSASRGNLEARFMPFLPQPAYDELLWACAWNFVRGEDSFVRAQWAGRPMVWHIYPQTDGAHARKLEAFLSVYCAGLEPEARGAMRSLWGGWNAVGGVSAGQMAAAWAVLARNREKVARNAVDWPGRLALPGDLAANLAQFCSERLK
jgi:uncharacterized repeat protein (TIGR03837 family)